MLKNEDILCISTIDWEFNWQGHQEIMTAFARNGNRVLYIENMGIRVPHLRDLRRLWKRILNWKKGIRGIRKVQENLYVFSPIVLPFPFSRTAQFINRWVLLSQLKGWFKAMSFDHPIIWTFLPSRTAVNLIKHLNKKLVVYYCITDFAKLVATPRKIRQTEKELLKECDVVFAQGEELKRLCERYHSPVHIFPFGVNPEIFLSAEETSSVPQEIGSLKRPIVGYCGGIHRHVDYRLVRELAVRRPDWSLVFVGPIQTDISTVEGFKNVFFLGEKAHSEIPYYIKSFDVCLVPYLLSEYTSTVYPTKMNEYLILGKPVVSTNLPEVRDFNARFRNVIRIGRTYDEFENFVLSAMTEDNGKERKIRREVALENSWERRIEEMCTILEENLNRKIHLREEKWQEIFLHFLRSSRNLFVRWAIPLAMGAVLVFYTPLVWFLAEPLRLSDLPQKADAIVVLGGGVGETGRPGTSTLERARYASELYNEGWAPAVIFSSGFVYSYREAEDMKLIAISSGVPEKAILTETKSSSTYENVQFVKEILDRKGWRSVLLVSAPYHMRRVSLVFRKTTPTVTVRYLPVPKNSFYGKGRRVQQGQIRALFHEVAGILYYWLKRYV